MTTSTAARGTSMQWHRSVPHGTLPASEPRLPVTEYAAPRPIAPERSTGRVERMRTLAVGLFTAARAVPNFRHRAPAVIATDQLVPCPTSAPFRGGYARSRGPICPVMSSRCLSAGSLCLLGHLVLLGSCSSLAVGRLACRVRSRPHDQTPTGFPRSASLSTAGVGAPYTPGPGVPAES